MIKRILLGLIVLILLYAITLLIMPGKVSVSRSMDMNAPPEIVYEQIYNLENWENWSYWEEIDPDMEVTYGQIKIGKGASYSWDGPKSGEGTLSIVEAEINKSMETAIDFGPQGTGSGHWTLSETNTGTNVNWEFKTELKGFEKLTRPLLKMGLGPALRKGLENMKEHLNA